jgi:hypothetical protein
MSGEAWLYLLAVLINAVNLFLQVFFTIMYSDLEWSVLSQLLVDRAYSILCFVFVDGSLFHTSNFPRVITERRLMMGQ